MKNLTNFEVLNAPVNVTVHKNHLKDDNSSYVRVDRRKADINNLIAEALKLSHLGDKVMLVAAYMLFKDAILSLLKRGIAVNLFDLGTLYLNAQGSIDSADPTASDMPSFSLGFTPSNEALSAVATTEIAKTNKEDTSPVISKIENLKTHKTDYQLSLMRTALISGFRLMIALDDEKSGIFFAPSTTDGLYERDEESWIKLEKDDYIKNTARYIEFNLPDALKAGTYILILRTSMGNNTKQTKSLKELIFDKVITVS